MSAAPRTQGGPPAEGSQLTSAPPKIAQTTDYSIAAVEEEEGDAEPKGRNEPQDGP